jgi:hypothetical protein
MTTIENNGNTELKTTTKAPAKRGVRIIHTKRTVLKNGSLWQNHKLTPALKKSLPKEHVFFIERLTALMIEHPKWQKQNKFQKRFNFSEFCVMDILTLLNPDKKLDALFKATN